MTQAIHPNRGGLGRTDAPDENEIPIGNNADGFEYKTIVAGQGIDITHTTASVIIATTVGETPGDMQAATYDPQGVAADAFDTDNHTSGTNNKVYTAAEQTKLGYISVTQAVDLDQMETDIAALANGMVYKGNWDASAASFPGAGAAQTGWFYTVSVGGTVDGVTFVAGDRLIAIADNASQTTYAANWTQLDATDAVQSVAGLVGTIAASSLRAAINVEDGADATDAANVGSSIHGATAKTTPVDTDTVPLIDSAASNALKKVTWANIKATLKTYFDTLYVAKTTTEYDNGSKTTSFSVDFGTNGRHQKVTLTANTMTLTLDTTDVEVGVHTLKITNGGLATLTWASETGVIDWPGGTTPTLTSSGYDIISLRWDGTNWQAISSLAFS